MSAATDLMELEQIEASLRATDAVGSVVQAVWALSRAQLPRVEEAAQQALEYLEWVDAVVDRLAGPPRPSELEHSLTVILGPERSFCGPLAQSILAGAPPRGPVGLVGTRLAEIAERTPDVARREVFRIPGPGSVDELGDASRDLAAAVLASCADAPVDILYPRGERGGVERAVLLSVEREKGDPSYELYSPLEEVLGAAVREALTGRLRIVLTESLKAEIRARVTAAERAKRAVEDRRVELEVARRVRMQEQVTRELTELVAGTL